MYRFLLFLMPFLFSAQNHRFIYEVNFKKDSTENLLTKEFYFLDIGSEETFYYGKDYFVMDSLMMNNLPIEFKSPPNLTNVTIHKNKSRKYDEYELLEYDMIKLSSENQQSWKLLNEKKQIDKYNVQKAETLWGGRKWTAWFTTEIPFQEGPYKFGGLPGMILELNDDKNNYSFKVIRSYALKDVKGKDMFGLLLKNAAPVSLEKYYKIKLSHYQDPLSFLKNGMMDMKNYEGVFLKDGTKVTNDNQRDVIATQQKILKKYNNPVELDKAIQYP